MNSRLGQRDVRLRGPLLPHTGRVHTRGLTAVEAPRRLRGFPQLLRRGWPSAGRMNSRLGQRDVRLRGPLLQHTGRVHTRGLTAVEAPRRLRGFPQVLRRGWPSAGRMNSQLGQRDVRVRGPLLPHTGRVHTRGLTAVEAPRRLRGFPQVLRRGWPSAGRMNSRLGQRDVRLRGPLLPHTARVHTRGLTAVEAPRSLRGFPQVLRRVYSLPRTHTLAPSSRRCSSMNTSSRLGWSNCAEISSTVPSAIRWPRERKAMRSHRSASSM